MTYFNHIDDLDNLQYPRTSNTQFMMQNHKYKVGLLKKIGGDRFDAYTYNYSI